MIKYLGKGTEVDGDQAWKDGFPWLIKEATDYIKSHLPGSALVFEWGSGGSTIWFARQGYHLLSLELDVSWAGKVKDRLIDEGIDARVSLLEFSPSSERGISYYVNYISHVPDKTFDLILVDGRHRVRCLEMAINKVKPGGMVCLDNSDRSRYEKGINLYQEWEGVQWGGPAWKTTIWHRPD